MNKIILLLPLLLYSCTTSRTLVGGKNGSWNRESDLRLSIASQANQYLGTGYRYGGLDKKGLDCSGLVYLVFRDHSLSVPRSSAEQRRVGRHTTTRDARVGDLIFFRQQGKVNHVAIVTGVDRGELWVTHSTTSRGVIKENLNASAYWSKRIEDVRDIVSAGLK